MTAPFLAPAGNQEPLANNAPSAQQLGRLLDALLILDVEEHCRVGDLALRVGLQPQRLRELLAAYMVAGSDVVGPTAPLTVHFGPDPAPGEDETVHVSSSHGGPVLDDLGRRAVSVEEVARGLLAAQALLVSPELTARHRLAVQALADELQQAMTATVTAPLGQIADQLRAAVKERHKVRFRYRDPWSGVVQTPEVEPYDVRRHRDRLLLDAGPEPAVGFRSYDISAITQLVIDEQSSFTPSELPPRDERDEPIRVVLRVPKDSGAEDRLYGGWKGKTVGPAAGGQMDVAIKVDRSGAADRLGVLMLQLGWPCEVVEPPQLASAAVPVAHRLLAMLPPRP